MSDEASVPIAAAAARVPTPLIDRRNGTDRRRLTLRTLLRGGFAPRRRGGRRSTDTDSCQQDWRAPHLMFLAIAILLLSVADAYLTLSLLSRGAIEANPLLAFVLNNHAALFAGVKMLLTGLGVIVLIACANVRVFGRIRVSMLIHGCMFAYVGLIVYECWLLHSL